MAKSKTQGYRGKGALELIEEAVHALRVCPVRVLGLYYIGTLPFVLGFLFFWSDMSRSALALDRSVAAALGLMALYFWMKLWQSIFCRELLASWTPRNEKLTLTRLQWFRRVAALCFLQCTAIGLQVVSLLLLIPFGWSFAFFQNVTVLAFTKEFADSDKPTRALLSEAARQSNSVPMQNHALILLGMAFAFFVWLNVYSALAILPFLLKRLTGMESMFTTSPAAAILNTTFLGVSVALAFLCVSPLVKILYMLRCYYGVTATTGADLIQKLHAAPRPAADSRRGRVAAVGLMLFFALMTGTAESAAAAGEGETLKSAAVEVSPGEVDEAIEEVISRREYSWRLPRERPFEDGSGGPVGDFFRMVVDGVRDFFTLVSDTVEKGFGRALRWIFGSDMGRGTESGNDDADWGSAVKGLFYILGGVVALLLIVLAVAAFKRRLRRDDAEIDVGPVSAAIDLESEEIVASQLPEDEWMKLAREQMDRGEFRLAIRALFLASLASLGERHLLRIEKSKSNLDYQRELRRRARMTDGLLEAFADNVTMFERAWYGLHEVTSEAVDRFTANYQQITSGGTAGANES